MGLPKGVRIKTANERGEVQCPKSSKYLSTNKCVRCKKGRMFTYNNGIDSKYPEQIECWFYVKE